MQWLLVALCVVMLVMAAMLIRRERDVAASLREMRQEMAVAAGEQEKLERDVARERAAREAFQIGLNRERAANDLPGIALQPGLDPSGKPAQELRIPTDVSRVELVLPLGPKRYDRYRAAIRPWSGGDELWAHAMLHPDADRTRLAVAVPVEIVPGGAYELSLDGITAGGRREPVATFTFEVTSHGRER